MEKTMNKKNYITKDEEKIIVTMYRTGGYTIKRIANLVNRCDSSVRKILYKNNIKIEKDASSLSRKYNLDETFFDTINTEEKAYFLGLLYADGCNFEKTNHVSISLQEQDVDILYKLNICLKNQKPLRYISYKDKPKWSNQYKIDIYSKYMSKQLASLGCISNKSLKLKFPKWIPDNLLNHFVRGYFDGDGSFGVYSSGKSGYSVLSLSIASTNEFCTYLSKLLEEKLKINSCIYSPKNKETKILKLSSKSARKFLIWIYKNSSVSLDRKYKKFLGLDLI